MLHERKFHYASITLSSLSQFSFDEHQMMHSWMIMIENVVASIIIASQHILEDD